MWSAVASLHRQQSRASAFSVDDVDASHHQICALGSPTSRRVARAFTHDTFRRESRCSSTEGDWTRREESARESSLAAQRGGRRGERREPRRRARERARRVVVGAMSDQAVLLLRKQLKGASHRDLVRFDASSRRAAVDLPPTRARARVVVVVVGVVVVVVVFGPSRPLLVFVDRRRLLVSALPPRAELSRNPIEGFSAGLADDSNVFEWAVTIMGPPDTM